LKEDDFITIFKLDSDSKNYDSCFMDTSNPTGSKRPFALEGISQGQNWLPRKTKRYNELPLGDYITHIGSDAIIVEYQAIKKLRPWMGNVEVLPLDCDFGDYRLINILDVLTCVDYKHSEYISFGDTHPDGRPRIMTFNRIAFFPESIKGHHLFKIVDLPKSVIYADEVFVNAVKINNITGFLFKKVWES